MFTGVEIITNISSYFESLTYCKINVSKKQNTVSKLGVKWIKKGSIVVQKII